MIARFSSAPPPGPSTASRRRWAAGARAAAAVLTAALLGLIASCDAPPGPAGGTAVEASARRGPEAPALPPPAAGGGFTDVTRAAGIRWAHQLPTSDLQNIVDATGAGAALSDLDGDGWLDLLVLGGPASPAAPDGRGHAGLRLYRNRRDGTFEDATAGCGIPADSTALAIAIGDVDGDGDRDIYLVDRGPNRLYRNRGDGVFDDVTRAAGVGDAHFGVGAVFLDLERDGDLDLYVTNYVDFDAREDTYFEPDGFPGPLAYRAEADVLYRNRGDGTFEEISAAAGLEGLVGRGMSLAAGDFDDDGDTDLFVANDATANFLLVNDGAGRFTDEGFSSGLALGENGEQTSAMSADIGDVDGDGQLDLAVSDTAFGALYLRDRPGLFTDDVMQSGLAMLAGQYVSWGQLLLDVDNDGDLDLFLVNSDLHHLVGWEDLLLRNDGTGRFRDASAEAGPYFADRRVGRCAIAGDYDNDGDIDLFVTALAGEPALLRNDAPGSASWLTLDLVGDAVRDPFGARITVDAGGRSHVAESRCPSVFLGQGDPRIHFGLGEGVEMVDRILVDWPDGSRSVLRDVPARQILRIERERS